VNISQPKLRSEKFDDDDDDDNNNNNNRPNDKNGAGLPLRPASCNAPAVLLDRRNDTSEVMGWENLVFHCNCTYHKFHVHDPGLELIPSQRETWAF